MIEGGVPGRAHEPRAPVGEENGGPDLAHAVAKRYRQRAGEDPTIFAWQIPFCDRRARHARRKHGPVAKKDPRLFNELMFFVGGVVL